MRFLIFGDVVGKLGRRALIRVLPELQADMRPDFTIVQAENLAHGKGITEKTLDELRAVRVDCFTGGNHTFAKPAALDLMDAPDMIRPANMQPSTPGVGYRVYTVGDIRFIVLNLQGEVFMPDAVDSPFATADRILNDPAHGDIRIRLIDFHGETTSERVAFGWYVDGRASLVWGTHTHVQTNDARVLPGGTGYITDIGMVGDRNGVIGVKRDVIVNNFVHPDARLSHDFVETGEAIVCGIVADIDEGSGQCTHLETITIAANIQ